MGCSLVECARVGVDVFESHLVGLELDELLHVLPLDVAVLGLLQLTAVAADVGLVRLESSVAAVLLLTPQTECAQVQG